MRKLMWFTIGFAAVCAFCAYSWTTENLMIPAIFFGVGFLAFAFGSHWVKPLRYFAAIALGCALGLGWFACYSQIYLSPAVQLDGKIADTTARCTDYGYETQYGTAVETILYLDGMPYRAKLYVSGDIEIEPGDVITGAFRFRVTTPDGAEEPTSHRSEGIFLLGYQEEDAELLKLTHTPGWALPTILRQNIKEIVDRSFPEDTAGFSRALLLGDRTGIDYETDTSFKVSGISHIIAVSGLHVSILFSLVYVLFLKRRWLVALVGIPVLVLFAAVAGFSPSVTRAVIMMVLMMLALAFDRDYDGPTELSFSCLVMLAVNPLVITSVSFQLSVGCIVGIFLFYNRILDWILARTGKRFVGIGRWAASSVAMTLSTMTMNTILIANYFGTISLVGVVTNLLTLWVVTFIFYGVMLVCVTGWFWPAIGSAIAGVISWLIRYVLFAANLLSDFPLSAIFTRSIYVVAWLAFLYVLLAVFIFSKKKRPGTLLCCAVLGLCLCIGASWIEPMLDSCRMTVLDVGQGQCILLQSEGKTYMVDCGGSDGEEAADLAADTLMSMGIFRLDGVILTHYDEDHSGGLKYLLTRIPADMLFLPDAADENGVGEKLSSMAQSVSMVKENLLLSYGQSEITIFGPVVPDSSNESSLAVLFRRENCDILITGDRGAFAERMLLKTAQLPELEVLVVGHHGSKTSTCGELLDATSPALAVISVGENSYGHPADEVLQRLNDAGCVIYRTDRDGNIVFRR